MHRACRVFLLCPLPDFPVYIYKTVSFWQQPFATLAFVAAIRRDSPFYSPSFSVIWTKTEGAIPHSVPGAHSLTDRDAVCSSTTITACQITGCFSFRSSKPSYAPVCPWEAESVLSVLGEIHNWYCEFHSNNGTWLRSCSWLLEIW